jgi:hypothetical protein
MCSGSVVWQTGGSAVAELANLYNQIIKMACEGLFVCCAAGPLSSWAAVEPGMEGLVMHICMDAAESPLKTLLAAVGLLFIVFAASWRHGSKLQILHPCAEPEPGQQKAAALKRPCRTMASQKQILYVKDLAEKHSLVLTMDPAEMTMKQAAGIAACLEHTVFCNHLKK